MDSIADILVRIQSALNAKKESADIPHSRMKEAIAKILLEEGYIAKFDVNTRMSKKNLRITLKPGVIRGMKRISKPGSRIYTGAAKVPRVQSGFGTAIISTSRGLMTDGDARRQKLGGEIICSIW